MSAVENPVKAWLRAEAFVVFVAAVLVWIALDGGWGRFALGFFVPDLALLAYLIGPRIGSIGYNIAHSYVLPAIVAVIGAMFDQSSLTLIGAIWTAHIGFDRAIGYGLKYPTSFHDTHLGVIGRVRKATELRTRSAASTSDPSRPLFTTDEHRQFLRSETAAIELPPTQLPPDAQTPSSSEPPPNRVHR